jgi:hypothetical protein
VGAPPILEGKLGALLPLVPLMRGAGPEQLPELAGKVLELPDLDVLNQADLISMLAGFGALRFPDANVWDLLRRNLMLSEMIEELIEDSPFLRQIRDEARQKSREEGREEGRAEGHVEEARVFVRTLALARFPALTTADLAPLDRAVNLEHLRALVPALAAAVDLDEARRLLRAVGP